MNIPNIPKEKFSLVQRDEKIFDAKFETKPITYLQDAWMRFKKNKASVTASYILIAIILFAILGPIFSRYSLSYSDAVYAKVRPKLKVFERGSFWNGALTRKLNDKYLIYSVGIGMAAEHAGENFNVSWDDALKSDFQPIIRTYEEFDDGRTRYRNADIDSYYNVGFRFLTITKEEYNEISAWQEESGKQVLYPMIDFGSKYAPRDESDANEWYRQKRGNPVNEKGKSMTLEQVVENGLVENYLRDADGKLVYSVDRDKTMLGVRVLYYNYYQFVNGAEPINTFGVDANGNDILVRMAHGIRLSLALAFAVSIINFFLGSMYGAAAGFYGGWIDLLLERFTDILNGMPFIVVATLFQLHLVQKGKVSVFGGLLFAFVLTGWIPIGARVRTQFYRFKKQEYILAAQTLGASDARLMFKHIFPNAIGTIITSTALVIPGVIYTESSLSYLGIVNFHGKDMSSLGTMLGTSQGYLETDPHLLFFPAIILSLMMISFNLFSNGLRDAFNPSLRGVED